MASRRLARLLLLLADWAALRAALVDQASHDGKEDDDLIVRGAAVNRGPSA